MSKLKDLSVIKEQFMHVMHAFDAKPDGRMPRGVKVDQVDRVLDGLNGGDGYDRGVSSVDIRRALVELADQHKIEVTSDRLLRLMPGS